MSNMGAAMTMRERLADWISGGELTRARVGRDDAMKSAYRAQRDADDRIQRSTASWHRIRHALNEIAAMETPGANATVKRMAKVARQALEGTE